MSPTPKEEWEARFNAGSYIYGTEPNDFLVSAVTGLPPGDVLCLADGEGRNGVFLASIGHRVTSVDLTETGMARASTLASKRGVALATVVADLVDYDLGEERWDMIVSIFAHTPPGTRSRIHALIATALRPTGRFILEAYTPDQIGRGTGGPPVPELMMSLVGLGQELAGMRIESGREIVRPVMEGPAHTGDGAVVQIVAVPEP